MNKPEKAISLEVLKLYDKVIATIPSMKRKGKTIPYTSLNGHMFSFLSKDGKMCLRLSKNDREMFMQEFHSDPVIQYGSVMKEYVEVPDGLFRNTEPLSKYFQKSVEYILSLKPK